MIDEKILDELNKSFEKLAVENGICNIVILTDKDSTTTIANIHGNMIMILNLATGAQKAIDEILKNAAKNVIKDMGK